MAEIYELPQDRIAQRPVYPPEAAKLLVVDRENKKLSDLTFGDLPKLLSSRDLLVFNDTKVIPARIFGRIEGKEKDAELLLVSKLEEDLWICLGRSLKVGTVISIGNNVSANVIEKLAGGDLLVKFSGDFSPFGTMPIPPYIRSGRGDAKDREDYQTVFAKHEGSIAAPTASLHFSKALLDQIRAIGAIFRFLTLHVGTASFRQVSETEPPTSEKMDIDLSVLEEIKQHKNKGGRVIAVGTTAVRALESAAHGVLCEGKTELFITPGFKFKLVDSVITNFHQPKTTHMLLVEALLGNSLLTQSYQHALGNNYRFLSYGDGMFII